MLLERVLFPVTKEVRTYNLVGRNEYGQPQYAPTANPPLRGTLRRTTRLISRGEKAIMERVLELVLDGAKADQSLLGAKVTISGEPVPYVVKLVRREGDPFLPLVVCELEELRNEA